MEKENMLVRELKKVKVAKEAAITGDEILSVSRGLLLDAGTRDEEVLKRLGLNHIKEYQQELTADVVRTKKAEAIYALPTFTGDQLKTLCNTYYLKVLPCKFYNGALTAELPRIVDEFCKKHEINLQLENDNFYILAPTEQFATIKNVPQSLDPILFYCKKERGFHGGREWKIEESDVLVQIHNWGSDFSFLRMFRVLFNNTQLRENDATPWQNTMFALSFTVLAIISALLGLYVVPVILIGLAAMLFNWAFSSNHYIFKLWNQREI